MSAALWMLISVGWSADVCRGLDVRVDDPVGPPLAVESVVGAVELVDGRPRFRQRFYEGGIVDRPVAQGTEIIWMLTDGSQITMPTSEPADPIHHTYGSSEGVVGTNTQWTLRFDLTEDIVHALARAKAEAMLGRVGLASRLKHYPKFLSGGEQRRGGLARVLLADPAFAFVDEPDAGLDAQARLRALQLLRDRCDAGMSCLLVTHNRDLARRFADRRWTLEEGVLHAG